MATAYFYALVTEQVLSAFSLYVGTGNDYFIIYLF